MDSAIWQLVFLEILLKCFINSLARNCLYVVILLVKNSWLCMHILKCVHQSSIEIFCLSSLVNMDYLPTNITFKKLHFWLPLRKLMSDNSELLSLHGNNWVVHIFFSQPKSLLHSFEYVNAFHMHSCPPRHFSL